MSDNRPEVSIIICVYNAESYLRECLDSVLAQTRSDWELVCVDDGSSDGSIGILNEYAARESRIHVYPRGGNFGLLSARKFGVLQATGNYVMFLDDDDVLLPMAVEELTGLARSSNSDIVQFGAELVFPDEISEERRRYVRDFFSVKCERSFDGDVAILDAYFGKCLFPPNLWSKLYEASLIRSAYDAIADEYMIVSEDAYAVFHVSAIARRLTSVFTTYYRYRVGVGVSYGACSKTEVAREIETVVHSVDNVRRFIDERGLSCLEDAFFNYRRFSYKHYIRFCVSRVADPLGISRMACRALLSILSQASDALANLVVWREVEEERVLQVRELVRRFATYPCSDALSSLSEAQGRGRYEHELLAGSVYWDEVWYLVTNADVVASGLDPLEHYLRFGWKEFRNPSRSFDTAWYLFRHPAVKENGVCPLVDYLECGLNSGELPSCMEDLPPEEEVRIISESALFDADYYIRQIPGGCCVGNPAVHYLRYGWKFGIAPSEEFNPVTYCEVYPDAAACGFAPLLQYLRFGISEGRILPPQGYDLVKQSGLFDEWYYISLHEAELNGLDPICHYLLKGWRQGFNPSKRFSQEGYMSFYIDLWNIGMAPLLHYLRYGKSEGRCMFPCEAPKKWYFPDGFDGDAFFSRRDKLLIVVHQLDHSGVPMLSKRIAALYRRSAAILSPIDGSLRESCLRDDVPVVVDPMFFAKKDGYEDYRQCGFGFCLFNCAILVNSFLNTYQRIPSIFWVHDNLGREFMPEDLRVQFSLLENVYATSSITLQFVRTYAPLASFLPYPVCDLHCTARTGVPKRIRFAVVARIEPRKGQDIAVRAVKLLPPGLKAFAEFQMVGDFVSDAVRQELMHLAQGENIVFHDAVKDQEAYHSLYEDIDVLLCPSRTDPMPLVVLDAMMHGCPVIVSDQVGEKDFVVDGVNGYVFKSEDVESLRDALEKMIKARESYPAMSAAIRKTFEDNFAATRAKDSITEALSAAKSYCA